MDIINNYKQTINNMTWQIGLFLILLGQEVRKVENDMVYIIPTLNNPIKIVFENLPCPINGDIRCKYAENKSHDMIFSIICKNYKKEECLL